MLAKLEKPSQKSVSSQAHTARSTVSYHRNSSYPPCGTCAAIGLISRPQTHRGPAERP